MGNKNNPIGLRLGNNRTWYSRWYAEGSAYGNLLMEDLELRRVLEKRLVPVPGCVCLFVEIMKPPTVPKPALQHKAGTVMVDGDGVGGVGLQLDRVRAGSLRRVDQA